MSEQDRHKPDVVSGKDDTVKALQELLGRFERGEINCAALRVYKADGTWENVVLGGSDDERVEALANLQRMYREAH